MNNSKKFEVVDLLADLIKQQAENIDKIRLDYCNLDKARKVNDDLSATIQELFKKLEEK